VGDFGFGWSLGLKNIRVEKSGVLGFKWFETASQEVFPNYCVEPTGSHVVTVTFPGGKVFKFQAQIAPHCQRNVPITGGTLLKLVIPQPARSGAAASAATASTVAPASSAGPESEAPRPCAPARTSASSRQVVDARAGEGRGVASVARAGPGDVAASERPEFALRAELADNTGAAFTAACDVDVLETLCQTWNSFLGRGRGS